MVIAGASVFVPSLPSLAIFSVHFNPASDAKIQFVGSPKLSYGKLGFTIAARNLGEKVPARLAAASTFPFGVFTAQVIGLKKQEKDYRARVAGHPAVSLPLFLSLPLYLSFSLSLSVYTSIFKEYRR